MAAVWAMMSGSRSGGLCLGLLAVNLLAWVWALLSFAAHPLLLGTAAMAWGFGLRHAVDLDHIAAIDNATRRLVHTGQHPAATGFWFALGHSTVVVLVSLLLAVTAVSMRQRLATLAGFGGVAGSAVSAVFLFAMAAVNLVAVLDAWRALRSGDTGLAGASQAPRGGMLTPLLRPLFRLVTRSWHLYPIGVLFALGFDTATEVGVLGMSAGEAAGGLPLGATLVFPLLFTAGMALVDTLDSALMAGAYGWAYVGSGGRLRYNLAITLASVAIALGVGILETRDLLTQVLA